MLRPTIACAISVASRAHVFSPAANAQSFSCEQPALGLVHAEAAQAGLLGAGGHIPGQEQRGFSSLLP